MDSQQGPTLNDLAAQITAHAKTMTDLIAARNMPPPSFAADAPVSIPLEEEYGEIQTARFALMEAAEAIRDLAMGPDDCIKWMVMSPKHDQTALQVINNYNIAQAVPLDGDISFGDLAAKVGLPESRLRRLLRHATTARVFRESRPGYIGHTGPSSTLVRIPELRSWVGHNLDEIWPGCVRVSEALRLYGDSEESGESAFNLAHNIPREKNFFHFLEEDGEGDREGWRMRRFGEAMHFITSRSAHGTHHIHQGFDWKSLDGGTVVDLGGSVGNVCVELASAYPSLKCITQDFPGLKDGFDAVVPAELKSRVTFLPHDFFTPQPVKDADAYIFRHILHDWSDKDCIRIMHNLIPALKDGARVIVIEMVQPPPASMTLGQLRIVTSMDIQMMGLLNSLERAEEDWVQLFAKADSRFTVKGFTKPPGAAVSIIEVMFKS